MSTFEGRRALVIGASSGVGRATARALAEAGASVVGVARGREGLRALEAESRKGIDTVVGDASDAGVVARLVREGRPDDVVVALGVNPTMGLLDDLDWSSFSETWNVDLQASFHVAKEACRAPLAPGANVVFVSSGAAIGGSPLSGGYAGAKRMQWWLAGYAQRVSDERKLGLRFVSVLPRQLLEGTRIGARASATYGAALGVDAEQYMKRFATPMGPDTVARAIVSVLAGTVPGGQAVTVTGDGIEPIP